MLKEIRAKRLVAQGIKARKGENPWKRKGKEISKQKNRKIISLPKRKGKLAAVKLFRKVLQQTKLASLNLRDDSSDDVMTTSLSVRTKPGILYKVISILFAEKDETTKCGRDALVLLGRMEMQQYKPAKNYVCEYC
jgi:hypothetical protein